MSYITNKIRDARLDTQNRMQSISQSEIFARKLELFGEVVGQDGYKLTIKALTSTEGIPEEFEDVRMVSTGLEYQNIPIGTKGYLCSTMQNIDAILEGELPNIYENDGNLTSNNYYFIPFSEAPIIDPNTNYLTDKDGNVIISRNESGILLAHLGNGQSVEINDKITLSTGTDVIVVIDNVNYSLRKLFTSYLTGTNGFQERFNDNMTTIKQTFLELGKVVVLPPFNGNFIE